MILVSWAGVAKNVNHAAGIRKLHISWLCSRCRVERNVAMWLCESLWANVKYSFIYKKEEKESEKLTNQANFPLIRNPHPLFVYLQYIWKIAMNCLGGGRGGKKRRWAMRGKYYNVIRTFHMELWDHKSRWWMWSQLMQSWFSLVYLAAAAILDPTQSRSFLLNFFNSNAALRSLAFYKKRRYLNQSLSVQPMTAASSI